MKIQISPIPMQGTNKFGHVASQCPKRKENITVRYSRGLRNQNGKHLVNIYESNIVETQVNQAEVYFLLKVAQASTNNINVIITYRQSCM